MDSYIFRKYQADLQVEHLLMEKEVKDAIYYLTNAPGEQQMLIAGGQDGNAPAFINSSLMNFELDSDLQTSSTTLLQNKVLEDIVK